MQRGSGVICCRFVQIPHVNRQEYTLLDVSEDGYVSST